MQKLPKNVGDLDKIIVAKGFKSCTKSNNLPNLVTLPRLEVNWDFPETWFNLKFDGSHFQALIVDRQIQSWQLKTKFIRNTSFFKFYNSLQLKSQPKYITLPVHWPAGIRQIRLTVGWLLFWSKSPGTCFGGPLGLFVHPALWFTSLDVSTKRRTLVKQNLKPFTVFHLQSVSDSVRSQNHHKIDP